MTARTSPLNLLATRLLPRPSLLSPSGTGCRDLPSLERTRKLALVPRQRRKNSNSCGPLFACNDTVGTASPRRTQGVRAFHSTAPNAVPQSSSAGLATAAAASQRSASSSPVKLAASNPALYQEVTRFALMPQTPINLDRMLRAGKAMTHKKMLLSALFVHNELPIRLAKRVFELDSLPTKLLEEPAILKLRDDYLKSWKSVVEFPRFTSEKDPLTKPTAESTPRIPGYALGERPTHEFIDSLRSFATIGPNLEGLVSPDMLPAHVLSQDAFLRLLQDIKWRHRADQVFMSLGIQSFKGSVPSMIFDHAGLQGFLDSFNRGRIGVRLLMGHQIAMTLDFVKGPKSMSTVGIIDVETDIRKVVTAAWEMAAEVARRYYQPKLVKLPPCEIRTPADHPNPTFTYIPTILHHILFELFKNSIRATVESRGFGEVEYPKVRVVVVGGKEDMIIKVSDQGRGVSRLDLEKMNSYMFTTAPPPTFTLDQALALSAGVEQEPPFDDVRYYLPLAGFGYGMPISRLYAEYLGGNLEVISMEGYGTDAYCYLERLGSAVEQMSDTTAGSIFDKVPPSNFEARRAFGL